LHEDDFVEDKKGLESAIEVDEMFVTYEKVEPELEKEFEITTIEQKQEEITEIQDKEENQISFTFDLPIQNFKEEKGPELRLIKEIDINEIEIVGLEEIKPEYVKESKIRHDLEDEFTTEINTLKSISADEKKEDENLNFELKVKNEPEIVNNVEEAKYNNEASPMNLTISELRNRAEDRRSKMKDFNYKFINKMNQSIDEIESMPAYKRMGVDLNDIPSSSEMNKNQSRMTLGVDENDEIQLRSNNSFLHDNVD